MGRCHLSVLTAEEAKLLQLAADGFTITQSADKMHLSESAVRTKRARLVHKMEACNITQAVAFAIRRSIIG